MNGTIQTVLGPVAGNTLGRVLPHEHLASLVPGPWLSGGRAHAEASADTIAHAVGALAGLPELGFDVVADLSPYGVVGRSEHSENVALLQEISHQSGVHIVAGSSVYLEPFSPAWTIEASLDEMTDQFIRDVNEGIGASRIRAGVLGEQATGLNEITAHEEKCLRAAARAQAATGVCLLTHTTHGTMALEQVDIVRSEGADLARVVIGHMDIHPDDDYVAQVLDLGVNVAFDTIGKENWEFVLEPAPERTAAGEYAKRAYYCPDSGRAARLVDLVSRGYAEQILLSQDLTGAEVYLNPATHGAWGYAYLGGAFIPAAVQAGLPASVVDVLVRDNPLRLLAGA